MIKTINPANETTIRTYPLLTDAALAEKLDAADQAFLGWKRSDFQLRKQCMQRAAELLRERAKDYALLIAQEMGKPLSQGLAEIEKSAWVCDHFAENAETYLQEQRIKTAWKRSKICYRPLGIIFAIMPWNFPFWQVFRFAAPALMAGNAALLKHASISSGAGQAITELIKDAGFPEALFQQLLVDADTCKQIIADERIAAVTLTGSDRAGRSVASSAGHHLKKSVLELGGCDPYLILEDADLDLAAKAVVTSRLNNCGQSCIAAKRVLVISSIQSEFIKRIEEQMKAYQMGDPQDEKTTLGPMAREDLRADLHQQVQQSIAAGAKLHCGGVIPEMKGYYYPATLLTDVKPGMPAFDEELFGPVLSLIAVENEAEAITLANQSQYGLGAAVFTADEQRGERILLEDIDAGSCFVNGLVISDPRLPFGGIKQSGYGRELSREGILEFVNIKTLVTVAKP